MSTATTPIAEVIVIRIVPAREYDMAPIAPKSDAASASPAPTGCRTSMIERALSADESSSWSSELETRNEVRIWYNDVEAGCMRTSDR